MVMVYKLYSTDFDKTFKDCLEDSRKVFKVNLTKFNKWW